MTDLDQARQRHQALAVQLEHHNRLYYTQDSPSISYHEYDQMMIELQTLEADFPELLTPESPSQRVGSAPLDSFVQIKHEQAMLSLSNGFTDDDIAEFDRRLHKELGQAEERVFGYVAEPKLDGLAVSIMYVCLLYTSPSPRDQRGSRMPSSA